MASNQIDYSSDTTDDSADYERIKVNKKRVINKTDTTVRPIEWDCETESIQGMIKRFRLKKLKSLDEKIYYYDNVSYFIWEYINVAETERLVKPSDEVCAKLRQKNNIMYEPYLHQTPEFW
jgi:hypothetical protein